jgi:hypothetical protein
VTVLESEGPRQLFTAVVEHTPLCALFVSRQAWSE